MNHDERIRLILTLYDGVIAALQPPFHQTNLDTTKDWLLYALQLYRPMLVKMLSEVTDGK